MNTFRTCYMCDQPATSDEHAPPKCLFPEQKDLPQGTDYRKKLIKVPSCDVHNTAKSKDDEYLLYILPASVGSNNVGLNQFLSKVQRAITRNSNLAKNLTETHVAVSIQDTTTNIWSNSVALKIDISRIQDSLEKMARAIYFYHTNKKHLGSVSVVGNFTLSLDDISLNTRAQELFAMAEPILCNQTIYGENPAVFTFKIASIESITLIELAFYGSNKALAVLSNG